MPGRSKNKGKDNPSKGKKKNRIKGGGGGGGGRETIKSNKTKNKDFQNRDWGTKKFTTEP